MSVSLSSFTKWILRIDTTNTRRYSWVKIFPFRFPMYWNGTTHSELPRQIHRPPNHILLPSPCTFSGPFLPKILPKRLFDAKRFVRHILPFKWHHLHLSVDIYNKMFTRTVCKLPCASTMTRSHHPPSFVRFLRFNSPAHSHPSTNIATSFTSLFSFPMKHQKQAQRW